MTKEKILSFLLAEHAARSKGSQLTRIYLHDGQMSIIHFLKENQTEELMMENKWLVIPKGNLTGYVIVDGNDIQDLKSGTALAS